MTQVATSRRRPTLRFIWLGSGATAILLLLVAGFFAWSWAAAERLVERVVADPVVEPSGREEQRLLDYIEGHPLARWPWGV
jgi:multidrug efflux pump subunit AcrA (membrane-fusion protein)